MKLQDIKVFTDQPALEQIHIDDLTKRGLLVPSTTRRNRPNCTDEIKNATAGEVVGYAGLSDAIKDSRVSQADARRLIAIESTRQTGWPRHSHISRLMIIAFSSEKSNALKNIKKVSEELWQKKAK